MQLLAVREEGRAVRADRGNRGAPNHRGRDRTHAVPVQHPDRDALLLQALRGAHVPSSARQSEAMERQCPLPDRSRYRVVADHPVRRTELGSDGACRRMDKIIAKNWRLFVALFSLAVLLGGAASSIPEETASDKLADLLR